jgi:hypothetical protein
MYSSCRIRPTISKVLYSNASESAHTTVPTLLSKSKIRDRYEEEKLVGLVVLSDNILGVLPAMITGRSDVRRRASVVQACKRECATPRYVSLTTIDL